VKGLLKDKAYLAKFQLLALAKYHNGYGEVDQIMQALARMAV
jgi:hypothetical protein